MSEIGFIGDIQSLIGTIFKAFFFPKPKWNYVLRGLFGNTPARKKV